MGIKTHIDDRGREFVYLRDLWSAIEAIRETRADPSNRWIRLIDVLTEAKQEEEKKCEIN